MISSTTLMLATLVFNAATVLGAPIRIPTAPEVVVRATVDDPILPRVEVVDVQPVRKRSVEGNANRPRLAREIEPEQDTRDTASTESVSLRDSLPEVEEIVRRYPRRALHDFYAKRSPEPSSSSGHTPQAIPRSEPAPELTRRFPRRALHDRYAQRSEPAPPSTEARSEGTDPDPHFQRRENPELFEKRSAPTTSDNLPREPEPEPSPAPVPEPAPEPVVKPQEQEQRRSFPRRVLAEKYEKRQEAPPPLEEAPPVSPTPTSAPTATPTATGANVDFNKVIGDAINAGTTVGLKVDPPPSNADPKSSEDNKRKETKITIHIIQQENSNRKVEPNPASTSTSSAPGSTPTASPTSTSTTAPSPSPSPEADGNSKPTDGETDKPKEEGSEKPPAEGSTDEKDADGAARKEKPATGAAESTPGSPPAAGDSADTPTPRSDEEIARDIDSANAAAEPIVKRKLGLSGALLATWTRRNIQN
jgi:hypothetical protein